MARKSKDLVRLSAAAKEEIGESRVDLPEVVQIVKELVLEKYPFLKFPPDVDNYVERSLRCRKFDFARSAKQVHAIFHFFLECYTIHRNNMYFLPSTQQEYFFESLGLALLKNRDAKGRAVIVARVERMAPSCFNLDKATAAAVMLLDEVTRCSVDTQRLGVVFVCDISGYEFGHAKQFSLVRIRALAKMIQGSLPVRFKGFHVIRSPALFTHTFALIRPFLGDKMKNRMHFHGDDLAQVYKEVSLDILPEFLGGKVPDNDYADLEFNRKLAAKDNYYKDLFRYGYFLTEQEDDKLLNY